MYEIINYNIIILSKSLLPIKYLTGHFDYCFDIYVRKLKIQLDN